MLVTGPCPTSLAVTSWRGSSAPCWGQLPPLLPAHLVPLSPGVPAVPLSDEGPPTSLQLREPHWYSVPARWQLAGWERSDSGDR